MLRGRRSLTALKQLSAQTRMLQQPPKKESLNATDLHPEIFHTEEGVTSGCS